MCVGAGRGGRGSLELKVRTGLRAPNMRGFYPISATLIRLGVGSSVDPHMVQPQKPPDGTLATVYIPTPYSSSSFSWKPTWRPRRAPAAVVAPAPAMRPTLARRQLPPPPRDVLRRARRRRRERAYALSNGIVARVFTHNATTGSLSTAEVAMVVGVPLRDRVSFGSHRARGVVHGQRRARPGGGHQPAWAARRATPCALARNSSRR